jgi:hypothetical protein
MHWRGDRLDFLRFNGAFSSLLGGDTLSTRDIRDFEAFALALDFPPHPLIDLHDNPPSVVQGGSPAIGLELFLTENNQFCVKCHALPLGTTGFVAPIDTVEGLGKQPMKIAHLRNLHEKIGFSSLTSPSNKLGFGYSHDGSEHDLDEFLDFFLGFFSAEQLVHIRAMLLSFPTGTHGAVGQEVTIDATSLGGPALLRLQALQSEADAGAVDLVAHTKVGSEPRGFLRLSPHYQSDRSGEAWSWDDVVDHVTGGGAPFVFMAVPAGEGIRMGVDRDEDGFYDWTERDAGSDPADPTSRPAVSVEDEGSTRSLTRILGAHPVPFHAEVTLSFYLSERGDTGVSIYDLAGRRVAGLFRGEMAVGRVDLAWDGRDDGGREVAPGVYFARLEHGAATAAHRILKID